MIYLPENEHARLKRAAEEEGRSMADIIREATTEYLHKNSPALDYFGFVGIGEGSADEAVSENVDKYIEEMFK